MNLISSLISRIDYNAYMYSIHSSSNIYSCEYMYLIQSQFDNGYVIVLNTCKYCNKIPNFFVYAYKKIINSHNKTLFKMKKLYILFSDLKFSSDPKKNFGHDDGGRRQFMALTPVACGSCAIWTKIELVLCFIQIEWEREW